MHLDIRNNELVFSRIGDTAAVNEFKRDLEAMKGVKPREYKQKFYISLAHLKVVRMVLGTKYKNVMQFGNSYSAFGNRFIANKNPVHIEWSPATCSISGSDIPWEDVIPKTCYFDKKALNSPQYGKSWSGYTHLFDVVKGEFPSGLLERVVNALREHNVPFTTKRTFTYPKPYLNLNPVFEFTPTEDQIKAVAALHKFHHGIAKLPTGFGKTSFVAAKLIGLKGVRSLFLANQRVLTNDAKEDFQAVFKNDDIKIGTIADGEFDPGDITVASIQSIAAALKEPLPKERELAQYEVYRAEQRLKAIPKDDEEAIKAATKELKKYQKRVMTIDKRRERHEKFMPFIRSVDLFIVDEAQVLGTDQWKQFLHACPAPYRYTLSATDTRTDGGRIEIVAATGERRYESSASEQIKKGRLSEFMGHFTKFDHKVDKEITKDLKMDYNQAYNVFIVNNDKRNRHLCEKVVEWSKDYSVIALVTRRAHGEIIKELLVEMGMAEDDVHYVDGKTAKKLRKDTIDAFRQSKFPVLIGTSIFDVGFNAKNASKIVRFNAGGSEVREPQRAGRTVRLREDGSRGDSYDILDVNVPFFESQGWDRFKFLREEFGENRVRFTGKTIEGELDIVGLQELVDAMPEVTDREKGERIIELLQLKENGFELPESEVEVDYGNMERNLELMLEELTIKE